MKLHNIDNNSADTMSFVNNFLNIFKFPKHMNFIMMLDYISTKKMINTAAQSQ